MQHLAKYLIQGSLCYLLVLTITLLFPCIIFYNMLKLSFPYHLNYNISFSIKLCPKPGTYILSKYIRPCLNLCKTALNYSLTWHLKQFHSACVWHWDRQVLPSSVWFSLTISLPVWRESPSIYWRTPRWRSSQCHL